MIDLTPEDDACGDDVANEDPSAESSLPPDEQDWHLEHHHRRLMRQLYDSIVQHIQAGDFLPSSELELALERVKAEIDWD